MIANASPANDYKSGFGLHQVGGACPKAYKPPAHSLNSLGV